ncbi:MAG: phosphodiester glycosidase family protein [Eubacteriales bacterium]|nr:phosphodiester glycosidase family protein [Eubacteriales bacterium]
MKKHRWTILFSMILLIFTAYTVLDTFVLASVYQQDAGGMNLSVFETVDDGEETDTGSSAGRETDPFSAAEEGKGAASSSGEKKTDLPTDPEDSSMSGHKKRPDKERTGNNGKGHPGKPGEETSEGSVPGEKSASAGGSGDSTGSSSKTESDGSSGASSVTMQNASAGTTYEDENVSITITEYTTNDTVVHVADVKLSSAEYLKTAFANGTYGKNVTDEVSDIAAQNQAILAVNGDYYGVQESGYVIRNGVVYRDSANAADLLCIYADGSMRIADQTEVTAQELVEDGVWQAFSFGPALVTDGEISVAEGEETGKAKASNPRTAIGVIDDLHYLFVVSDGRTSESAGLSLHELAAFMQQLGATTAYNLDGGGSSTMVFGGEIINNPTAGGNRIGERKVSDIVYIG